MSMPTQNTIMVGGTGAVGGILYCVTMENLNVMPGMEMAKCGAIGLVGALAIKWLNETVIKSNMLPHSGAGADKTMMNLATAAGAGFVGTYLIRIVQSRM